MAFSPWQIHLKKTKIDYPDTNWHIIQRIASISYKNQKKQIGMGGLHQRLYTKDGFKKANYSGPGTDLLERTKRGDEGITEVDKTANAHDLRYALSDNVEQIRAADIRMLDKLKKIKDKKSDYLINILPAEISIKSKITAENFNIIPQDLFADFDYKDELSDEDIGLLTKQLSKLELLGYGRI